MAEGIIDEDLPHGAAGGEGEDVLSDGWVGANESQGGGELVC